jgi:hypothetical protein
MMRGVAVVLCAAIVAVPLSAGAANLSLSPTSYPIDAAFTQPGPDATTTATITEGGQPVYDVFYPAHYASLGFRSPIVTWGNGTDATPQMYSTLLTHFASYGLTVIASTLANTGSGREIDQAAHYLVAQDTTKGSPFYGHLDVLHVASVGHSQGATGAVRAATSDPALITAVMTFSLPARIYSLPNPDCPTSADCTPMPGLLSQPTFFISTLGPEDQIIDGPANARLAYDLVRGTAAMGVIWMSGGKYADHSSVQDTANGGNPNSELGYATAWLMYRLRGNTLAAGAFLGTDPELRHNADWPLTALK